MENKVDLRYDVDGSDFSVAGEASSAVKKVLRQLNVDPEVIRKVSIAMYEGEINMVIHAEGGCITVEIFSDKIVITLQDKGPGIPDVSKAMQEGFSTASNEARELGFGAGMGLPNMKKYSDNLEIDTELGVGTKVTITILLT